MSSICPDTIALIDALQARYIHALDARNLQDWVDSFAAASDTSYLCISAENDERGLPIALMYDDSRDRIEDRVTFIEKIWAGTYQNYRTRHFIQRTRCEELEEHTYAVETNFSIIYTPGSGRSEVQVAGVYRDRVSANGAGAHFTSKRAVYDTDVLPRYIVYPF